MKRVTSSGKEKSSQETLKNQELTCWSLGGKMTKESDKLVTVYVEHMWQNDSREIDGRIPNGDEHSYEDSCV